MFLTKKAIPRRMFLQSTQAALALPLLDAMIPASTALAQTGLAGERPANVNAPFASSISSPVFHDRRRCRVIVAFKREPMMNGGARLFRFDPADGVAPLRV